MRMLKQRKAYGNVKKILKREGIRFQTPLSKIRIHWAIGMKTYSSAEEATSDLRRRGYEVEDTTDTGDTPAHMVGPSRLGEINPC